MRSLLDKKFFPYVIKPGRYAGGEPGQVVKQAGDRLKYLHAFPDKYELGQSYLGLQILYHVINRDDRFLCERVFAVDHDAEELMRREGIPLFSLESSRPAIEFDAIGFTLTYEFVLTNMLAMLDLAGIPLRSKDRTDEHPIIMAGGPNVYNPEPIADFVDLVFIGDAEEGLPQMLSILYELKGESRVKRLEALAGQVESVYVPRFYDTDRKPLAPFAPEKIKARLIKNLKPEYYPDRPIIPLIDIVHAHLGVEIMRGCPQGCRFCQAGPIYRPVRVRPQQEIMAQIETQIKHTGYDEVALVSLSPSDYPDIERLARDASRRLEKQRVSIALPSLRPGSISPELLEAAKTVRKSGLTMAPESGTERLRRFIRKDIPDSAIYDSARIVFEKGWMTLKLYFMIGLPTETDEDLMGIVNMIKSIHDIGRQYPGRKTINVTLSPFVPKAHTPFQWDPITTPEEVLRKIQFVKRQNRVRGVNFKYHSSESAVLAGVLGRGGREMADAIETAYRNGCRFDGWSESFEPQKWFAALEERGIDVRECLKAIPFDTDLPWSHIEKGVSVEHLQRERQRTSVRSKDLQRKYPCEEETTEPSKPAVQFGRTKKKLAARNTTAAPTKNRVRLRWGKTARYRYISHLDNMRVIERALRRARIPVAYSHGFNPTMKLSFGPPLPLGFTSECEFMDVTLEANLLPHMIDNLKEAMPNGIDILEARVVLSKSRSLAALLNRVDYLLPFESLVELPDLDERIRGLLAAEVLEIERTGKKETKVVDIRPAVYNLAVTDEGLLMVLGVGEGGYARPTEVAKLLLGVDDKRAAALPFHRKVMYRQNDNGQVTGGMDL